MHLQSFPNPYDMRTFTFRNFMVTFVFLIGTFHIGISQVLMYDNFDYPAGDSIIHHNWLTQQTNLTNAIMVSNAGLSYPNYACSGIGNGAAIGTTGQDVFRGFVKQTQPGHIYMAFLVKVTTATTGDCFITFKESPTSPTNLNYRGRAYAKADGSNNVAFGISKGAINSPASADYTAAVYSLNTTYLLVVKYKIVEGTTNDSAWLFVNPVPGNPEPSPSVTATDITASDLGMGSVLLRQGTTGSSPTVIVDGVRVAKTWQQALVASDISTLSDLKVDGSTVANFSPGTLTYNDTVPEGQTEVTIAATATDWAATLDINPALSLPGVSTVLVTSENGNNSTTYTVNHAYAYYQVSLSVAPPSTGTVTGSGTYGGGFDATVTATAATDYLFLNWTDGGVIVSTDAVYTFTVAGNTSLVAHFVPAFYEITATADPVGSITGAGTYPYGGEATLIATPNQGYDFVEWTENGNVIGTESALVITDITANHDVIAHFLLQTVIVTTTANPAEGGSITGGGPVGYGFNVTLNAFPNEGYILENWTEDGNILGTDPVLILMNVNSDRSITGNFMESANTYTVSATANPPEGGIILGMGNVPLGGSITLTAITDPDYVFLNWMENEVILGTDTSITLTNVSENHYLIANFESHVGISDIAFEGVKVYPTFASDMIHIEARVEIVEIHVFNLIGQKVISMRPGSNKTIISTNELNKGTYIIKVIFNKVIETRKVVVL